MTTPLSDQSIRGIGGDTLSQQTAVAAFRARGALAINGVFSTAFITRVKNHVMEKYDGHAGRHRASYIKLVGDRRWMYNPRLVAPVGSKELLCAPVVTTLMRSLLGQDFVLQSVTIVSAQPGAQPQHIHQDCPGLFPEMAGLNAMLPPFAIACGVPLVELGAAAGTTAIWEGSHRDTSLSEKQAPALAQLQPGDCYLMDSRLRHRGTANEAGHDRPVMYLVYSRPWFRDYGNFSEQRPLWLEPGDLDALPKDCRALLAAAAV